LVYTIDQDILTKLNIYIYILICKDAVRTLQFIERVTDYGSLEILPTPSTMNGYMYIPGGGNCSQPSQLVADGNEVENNVTVIEQCTPTKHYDYFSGSEYSFALSFLALGLCIPGKQ